MGNDANAIDSEPPTNSATTLMMLPVVLALCVELPNPKSEAGHSFAGPCDCREWLAI